MHALRGQLPKRFQIARGRCTQKLRPAIPPLAFQRFEGIERNPAEVRRSGFVMSENLLDVGAVRFIMSPPVLISSPIESRASLAVPQVRIGSGMQQLTQDDAGSRNGCCLHQSRHVITSTGFDVAARTKQDADDIWAYPPV